MKLVKFNKQMRENYERLQDINNQNYDLESCYGVCSYAKQRAFNYCKELEKAHNGFGKILGYSNEMFSYGFKFKENGHTYFAYITKYHDRYCQVD